MPKRLIFQTIDLETKKNRVVRDYSGTTSYSVRNPVSQEEVQRSLKRLKLNYDIRTQEIRPTVSEEKYRKRFEAAEHLINESGDLVQRYRDDTLCYGVPHWRAMSLMCKQCRVRTHCDKVVAYRLMFGGVSQFKAALSDIAARRRRYDRKAKDQSQGYELEALDRDIRDLRVLHVAYWKKSDETLGHRRGWASRRPLSDRLKEYRKKQRERDRIMLRFEGLPKPDPSDVLAVIADSDDPVTKKYISSISDGRLENRYQEYEAFRLANSGSHKWRKLEPGRLAIVKICRDAIAEFRTRDAMGNYHVPFKDVCETAVDLLRVIHTLHPDEAHRYGSEEMNYNQARRLVKTILTIEDFLKESSPEGS